VSLTPLQVSVGWYKRTSHPSDEYGTLSRFSRPPLLSNEVMHMKYPMLRHYDRTGSINISSATTGPASLVSEDGRAVISGSTCYRG
jgi:hypothetical protein